MNIANYQNRFFPITAIEVFNNYNDFDRTQFFCRSCGAHIAFNRGKDNSYPHFKNWQNINHFPDCQYEFDHDSEVQRKESKIKLLSSLILKTYRTDTDREEQIKIQWKYFNHPSTRKFLYSLADIIDFRNNCFLSDEYNNLIIRTEDGNIITAKDLIMRQDSAIEKYERENCSFIAIIIGYVVNINIQNGYAFANFTHNGKYGNLKPFRLYVRNDGKPLDFLHELVGKLIVCYGFISAYKNTIQMEIIKPKRQLVIMGKRHPTTAST